MTKQEAENYRRLANRLAGLGINQADQEALFRIERTLSRWSEMECGDEHGRAIERDEVTGKPFMTYESPDGNGKRRRYAIPDRERGALARLAAIMERYPKLSWCNQGDPRGCALYVYKKADMAGLDASSYYSSRGVAVCI